MDVTGNLLRFRMANGSFKLDMQVKVFVTTAGECNLDVQ